MWWGVRVAVGQIWRWCVVYLGGWGVAERGKVGRTRVAVGGEGWGSGRASVGRSWQP